MAAIFVLLSILIVVVSIKLVQKASGTSSFKDVNLVNYTIYSDIVVFILGSTLALLGYDEGYGAEIIREDNILAYKVHLYVLYALLGFALSAYITKHVLGINIKSLHDHYLCSTVKPVFSPRDNAAYFLFFLLSLFGVAGCIYTVLNLPVIPLFNILNSTAKDVAVSRILATREFEGSGFIKGVFAETLTPILSYVYYIYWKKNKTARWLWPLLIMFLCSVFVRLYALAKFPIIVYMMGFVLINIYSGHKLNWRKILRYAVSIFLILLWLFVAIFDLTIDEALNHLVFRTLTGQIGGLYWTWYLFPDSYEFLGLSGLPLPLTNLLGIERIVSARVTMEAFNPVGIENQTAGVMATLYIGEAYASFGFAGLLFGVIFLGIYFELIYIWFLKIPKNPINMALFVFISLYLIFFQQSGFIFMFFNIEIIATLLLFLAFYAIGDLFSLQRK